MEFRLIYSGSLPPQSSGGGGGHPKEKHAIRRELHKQLRELWHTHAFLKNYTEVAGTEPRRGRPLDFIAQEFNRFGYRFLPLVNKQWGIACSLDIIFLRRDDPGKIILQGGDLDNRIKTLFDALQVPQYENDVRGMPPKEGEDPLFCLLENDSLITDVRVTTDRLLLPLKDDEHINDVHLVLHARTKILDSSRAFSVFGH